MNDQQVRDQLGIALDAIEDAVAAVRSQRGSWQAVADAIAAARALLPVPPAAWSWVDKAQQTGDEE